jgi:hypothetical protein
MEWWRRNFGPHPVEMVVTFVAGGFLSAALAEASQNEAISLLVIVGTLGFYAWRRNRVIAALPPMAGMTSGEARAVEFEAQAEELHDLRGRVAELEERLDFAERMLAHAREPESLPRQG